MGIVEPEIEDIAQQDEVVHAAQAVQEFQEALDAPGFGGVGTQVEMGVGQDDRGGLLMVHGGPL